MDDKQYMHEAINLGTRGLGLVAPNPAVGCVIVKDGAVVGRGWTQPGGRPHAETIALSSAGESARGATAYVSLEPCAHQGATGPCAQALIAAGITRVVTALEDPDPRVSGKGHQMLRTAGISVVTGVLKEAAKAANRGFLKRVTTGYPLITLKLALSIDGRIATESGESKWITGVEARRFVHQMRAQHDAVVVGGRTARLDDPELTVRDLSVERQPIRIVATGKANLSLTSRLALSARRSPVWLLHSSPVGEEQRAAWERLGVRLIHVQNGASVLDPTQMALTLGSEGLTRVLCEGGGMLAASLLAADLVDEIVTLTAGLVLGAGGQPSVGQLNFHSLATARRYRPIETSLIGNDVMHRWIPEPS